MNDKDQIKDLFSDKLGNFEAPVNPELWANVASQVGAASGATAVGGGMSLLAKAIIGISGAAVLTTGVLLWTGSNSDEKPVEPIKKEVVQSPVVKDTPEQKQITQPESSANTTAQNAAPTDPVSSPISSVDPDPITLEPGPINLNANIGGPLDPVVSVITPATNNSSEEAERAALQEARRKDSLELAQSIVKPIIEPAQTVEPVVEDPNIIRAEEIEISFPNVFTPNGDRINDTYYIENSNVEFKTFEFVVYDQRGNVVMITKEADFQWTAMNPQTGMYLEKGRYAYVMIGETVDGVQCKKTGTITINE
ncbi:MAG: hypothetical protein Crog4KO_20230 [Crocinitomicaceae bacterium]